jgi:hypothetical protein
MTKRSRVILPVLAALVVISSNYFNLKSEANDSYIESNSCQYFSMFVAKLGLKKAIGLEAFRVDEEGGFFLARMAEWIGTEEAARDCVDIED